MLFTWSTENLCIIFPTWRISSTNSLVLSLLAVTLLTAGYEAVRELARRYEAVAAPVSWVKPSDDEVRSGRSSPPVGPTVFVGKGRGRKSIKAALYAVQVFYSFFIMLLFMTYNGWVMLSVAAGAFLGYMLFGGATGSVRTVACH